MLKKRLDAALVDEQHLRKKNITRKSKQCIEITNFSEISINRF